MAFNPIEKLPEDPAIKVFLSGLMIIQPDIDGKQCEIFVNRAALDHVLSIEVRAKQFKGPDLVLMRHVGSLSFLPHLVGNSPRFGLEINASNPKGLASYVGPPLPGGEETLDLAVNLKKDPFHHDVLLEVDPDGGLPSIMLNDGIFYTAEKTSTKLRISLDKGNAKVGLLDPFASLIGVNIYLQGEETLTLRWFEMGLPNALELTKAEEFDSYEIYILNDPLYIDEESPKTHEEFKEYYKILSPVPEQAQLKLEVTPASTEGAPKGTLKTPCMSVILPKPGI